MHYRLTAVDLSREFETFGSWRPNAGLGSPFMLLAMPIAFQEMVFAGYLIIRGLRVDAAQQREIPGPQVQPAGAPI